jgi:hypothetical protein
VATSCNELEIEMKEDFILLREGAIENGWK